MNHSFAIETEREEYLRRREAGENVVLAAAVNLPVVLKPLCSELAAVAVDLNTVSALNPIGSMAAIKVAREKIKKLRPQYESAHADCLKRLATPVEGATGFDAGWVQGFTSANGTSAFLELQSAFTGVGEALDRKSAYAMACFSLYIALISLVTTTIFGVLSIQ